MVKFIKIYYYFIYSFFCQIWHLHLNKGKCSKIWSHLIWSNLPSKLTNNHQYCLILGSFYSPLSNLTFKAKPWEFYSNLVKFDTKIVKQQNNQYCLKFGIFNTNFVKFDIKVNKQQNKMYCLILGHFYSYLVKFAIKLDKQKTMFVVSMWVIFNIRQLIKLDTKLKKQ